MLYLFLFTVVVGAIASLVFFLVYKRQIKKTGILKEKSFIMNVPKIFGSINIILALFFGIWYAIDPIVFSQNATIDNKIAFILMSVFSVYFYILALPLNVGAITLTVLLKKRISKTRFIYYIVINALAAILLFILSYLILSKNVIQ